MVALGDGSLVAGIFTSYNGVPLSAGEHYLIEERQPNEIVVRQPLGADTDLTLGLPAGWKTGDPIIAWAIGRTGKLLGSASTSATASGISFVYQDELSGERVASYRIFRGHRNLLSVIR
jgi:hypothetical protein